MGSRSLVEIRGEGIYQIRIPLPFPLRWVNAYLLRDNDGFTLIDPGLRTTDAEQCWNEALRTVGIRYSDVRQIVLTHHHPDHVGMAGAIQRLSGAKVYISAAGIEQIRYLWGEGREATDELYAMFIRHGMDADTGLRMREHMEGFVSQVSPLPEMTPLADQSTVRMGRRTFRTMHAPGHAFGQLMLFHEASGDLFCGDHVLPQISPNVGLLPRFDANPLASYLSSLEEVSRLPVKRAFPGHREPFAGFAERCRELIGHHRDRLERMTRMLKQPAAAYDVCLAFFGQALSIHQLRFAMAETLAHLVYLRETGQTRELTAENGTTVFFVKV